ncbi:hypothetical protein E2986_07251 [Frieseomelitta varia]|uniref:Large ribosomal subunit protein eL28 n=1 Tax=Frieseomelitta varia TaxID=561572 RepID=A0A833VVZ9_9HYME|nr:hypothetical protein E2986_07251 [Frieseomelitta varia]
MISFTMSSHLNWMIIRNNNAFLLKKRNINKPFSTESNNLTNLSSYRYSGLIHRKSVGIVDTPDKKGFTVVYKKAKAMNKPAKATVRCTMKAGARRSLLHYVVLVLYYVLKSLYLLRRPVQLRRLINLYN